MNDDFEDRIAKISATIDRLRESANDGKSNRQLLDSLFRDVHSLKAAANANGLNELAARAHEFEDLLHAVRTGKATLDGEALRAFTENTTNTQIESLVPDDLRGSLKEEERHRFAQCIVEGSSVYLVETSFDIS